MDVVYTSSHARPHPEHRTHRAGSGPLSNSGRAALAPMLQSARPDSGRRGTRDFGGKLNTCDTLTHHGDTWEILNFESIRSIMIS